MQEMQEMWVWFLGQEDPLKHEMDTLATYSSTLAWKISWAEETGGLQPIRSQSDGHNWAANMLTHSVSQGPLDVKLQNICLSVRDHTIVVIRVIRTSFV